MATLLGKIKTAGRYRTTYGIGLLQAKVYRLLKLETASFLRPQGISPIEWALLGLLYQNSRGMRLDAAALELGVKAPFITAMVSVLNKKNLLLCVPSQNDRRIKLAHLTTTGTALVEKIEGPLRSHMREKMKDISLYDVATYLSVLEQMAQSFK